MVQVAIAFILRTSNALRADTPSNPSWTEPDLQICDGLNAPVAALIYPAVTSAERLFRHYYPVEFVLNNVIYLLLVWLLWYLVVLEWTNGGRSVLAGRFQWYWAVDGFALAVGVGLVYLGYLIRGQFGGPSTYSTLIALPYVVWGGVIIAFYARDAYLRGL